MNTAFTRRRFLRQNLTAALAASAFPTIIPSSALGADGTVAPSNRVVVGCIGNGPQGLGVMGNFLSQKDAQVVAVSDVKKDQLEQGRQAVNQAYGNNDCQTYHSFQDILARRDIDAVLIATPDHWHVPVAVAAARAGKDMYLEKPMGLSVEEDQFLRKLLQKRQRVFQFGTQQRSSAQFYQACMLARNGHIGQLQKIHVWCSASRPGGSTKEVPVPAHLDYELWLGPARYTPYTENKCDAEGTKTWWYNYDYALGFIAGWGVHPLDIAYWGHPALLSGPLEVQGQAVIPTEGACNTAVAWQVEMSSADHVQVVYKGARNGYEKVTSMNDLSHWQRRYGQIADHGTAFEGTKGWVLVDRSGIRTSPENLVEVSFANDKVQLLKSSHHVGNFLAAVKSRGPTVCPIEDAVQADILCHVSDLATRLQRPLKWNGPKERFIDDTKANQLLQLRPIRSPWKWT